MASDSMACHWRIDQACWWCVAQASAVPPAVPQKPSLASSHLFPPAHPRSWVLPANTFMVLHNLSGNGDTCNAAVLTGSAAAQRATRLLAGALRLLSFPGPPPPRDAPLPSVAEECRTVLAYLQLCLGLVAPAVAVACLETRLYAQHAAQRRRAGLPPERGWWHPRQYAALADAGQGLDWFSGPVLAWTASAVLHAVAVAVSRAQGDA